jgi:chromate transporter
VGFSTAGLPGAIVATFAFALPSFILIYLVAHFLERFKNSNAIGAIMGGVRPVTVGLIAAAAIFIGAPSLLNGAFDLSEISASGLAYFNLLPIIICLCAAILNGKWRAHPILIVLAAGVIGAFFL